MDDQRTDRAGGLIPPSSNDSMTFPKHDFRAEPTGERADAFRAWLEAETISTLRRCIGDAEGLKAMIFLYVNRAHESHLPENEIGGLFGICFVRAGFPQADEDFAFDCLEFSSEIAKQVHNRPMK
jgi:hypothetical protein